MVGLVKRVGEGNRPYPSVARVAADPWVRGNQGRLGDVIAACAQLDNQIIRASIPTHTRGWSPSPLKARRSSPAGTTNWKKKRKSQQMHFACFGMPSLGCRNLSRTLRYSSPTVTRWARRSLAWIPLTSIGSSRKPSAGFAGSAKEIVNEDHNGVLIFAGGDDVLAFLPVDRCLPCARKLHVEFGELLKSYRNEQGNPPTLSVGVAIGHFMENLEDLLEYGRAAEKHAKQPDRDGLAVHLHKRGGTPINVRARWTENPDERITRYAQLILAEAIPGKLPYDLRNLARLYEGWPADTVARSAICQDVIRVIRDKQARSGRQHLPEIEEALKARVTDAPNLHQFAEELLVARQIASALRQAGDLPARITEVASCASRHCN